MTDRPPSFNAGTTYVANPVRLVDGREVLSDSAEWRAECEARYILNLPSKLDRQRMLAKIEEKRGDKNDTANIKGKLARRQIEQTIMALWRAAQPTSAA
jgi:hypothetical protein